MRRLLPALLVILAATPMLIASLALSPTHFFAGDAGPKYLQAQAFASHRPWPRTIPYPARAIDPSLRYLPVSMTAVHGRAVSFFPFLFPLIAALGFPLAGTRALLLLPALAALIAAWLTGRLASRLGGGRRAVLPAMALALGATPLMFYGSCLWAHTLMAAAVLAALVLTLAALERGTPATGTWLAVGVLAGIAGWIRTEGFLFLALAAVPLLWRRGRQGVHGSLAATTGAALGIALGSVLQRVALGAWLPIHIVAHITGKHVFSAPFVSSRLGTIRRLFVPDVWCGAALAIWLVALALAVRRPHMRGTRVAGLAAIIAGLTAALGAPAARFLLGVSAASAFPVRSATAVWLVLAALPLVIARTRPVSAPERRAGAVTGATAAVFVIVFLVASPVDGGYQWGARIFLPVVLMLAALLAARLDGMRAASRIERGAVATAIVAAVAVQLLGMALLVHVTRGNAAFEAALATHTAPHEAVLTDTFYLPELGAPLWSSRRFLLLKSPGGVNDVLARLDATHVESWTFASASDVNLDLGRRLAAAARRFGWKAEDTKPLHLPGRELTLTRYARSASPGADLQKTASSSKLPF